MTCDAICRQDPDVMSVLAGVIVNREDPGVEPWKSWNAHQVTGIKYPAPYYYENSSAEIIPLVEYTLECLLSTDLTVTIPEFQHDRVTDEFEISFTYS